MAMSQRSSSIRGGRAGFNPYGGQRQRQLPQPRPFRPPPPPTPPPPTEETFQPNMETQQLYHSSSFLLRLFLPGFTRLEEVKITNEMGSNESSKHAVRVRGERFDPQSNKRFRFDTAFPVPPEYDISPPIDAKLESGILTITFPKFSSSSSSSPSWDSQSQSQSQSSSDGESPQPSGQKVVEKEEDKKAVDQDRGEMATGKLQSVGAAVSQSPASRHDLSPASGLIKRTRDGHEPAEAMNRGKINHNDDGKAARTGNTVKEKLELMRQEEDYLPNNKGRDHQLTSRGEKVDKESEIKKESLPSTIQGRDGGRELQLVANMGAAVAVIVMLGAYTYYFALPSS